MAILKLRFSTCLALVTISDKAKDTSFPFENQGFFLNMVGKKPEKLVNFLTYGFRLPLGLYCTSLRNFRRQQCNAVLVQLNHSPFSPFNFISLHFIKCEIELAVAVKRDG